MNLSDSIETLPKVGPKTKIALNQLGIFTCQDLLFFLPFRYQNKTQITKLNEVVAGDEALIEVNIVKTQSIFSSKKMFICDCLDTSNQTITLRFFNLHPAQQQQLVRDATLQCFGETRLGQSGLEMLHPEYRITSSGQKPLFEKTLTPVYHTVQGIYQSSLRNWMALVLEELQQKPLIDPIMGDLNQSLKFLPHPD